MMKFLFEDEAFSFEALRAAGYANHGGADLGEVIAVAHAMGGGGEDAWRREWERAATRAHEIARAAQARGLRVSAREALLRASNYYRTAEFFLRDAPAESDVVRDLARRARETFAEATKLLDAPVEPVAIPYEGTTLPGYLYSVDGSRQPRPTVVYNNGFDSTLEESYFAVAAAALARGYNVLAFDGPGQGAALREQRLVFRHDWEHVLSSVMDFAASRSEIGPKVALFGYSLGGYLVARAAAFEPRISTLILDDGLFDFHAGHVRMMPPALSRWIEEERDDVANPVLQMVAAGHRTVRWALGHGRWAFGAASEADYFRKTKRYTLEGIASSVTCPTLVLEAENDHFFEGQAPRVFEELGSKKKTLVTLTGAEGAGEHCHMGAMSRVHQVVFDWLDETWHEEKR